MSIGLLIQVPVISAQEEPPEQVPAAALPEEDPLRAAELEMAIRDTPNAARASGSSVWPVIRMIIVLALVAVAIYGLIFLLKKAQRKPASNDPFLKVLASTHIDSNRYVHIVSVGSRAWLIGSGDNGSNLISEIDDKEIIDAMQLEDSRKSEEKTGRLPDFLAMMRRIGWRANTQTPNADDIRKRRERMKGM
ncbi:MAG: flagellar biosynthetic protein FliO [Treponema sp.]|nr:flagellar biosynthetic protein FliO [Treponema sp.]MCL2251346.1 flagellar biosynthetic protein FliO [Treponema sp.]